MLNGLDNTAQTRANQDKIEAWQAADKSYASVGSALRNIGLEARPRRPVAADRGDLGIELHRHPLWPDESTPLSFAAFRFVPGTAGAVHSQAGRVVEGAGRHGRFLFTGQFVFLFFAMQAGLPPGPSSALVQLQGPPTLLLAALFLERARDGGTMDGLAVAMVGVVLIARTVESRSNVFAIAIALLSALSWAAGKIFLRQARGSSIFAATVRAS